MDWRDRLYIYVACNPRKRETAWDAMKIVLVTGSYPPDICGVADYTARLGEALEKAGATVEFFTGKRWSLANSFKLSRELSGRAADVLHMQYPATGYGWQLGPQMLSLLHPFVMTIHECSQAHILRRISLYPYGLRTQKIIFTNVYEQDYCSRFAPWIKGRSEVIPIGSNVYEQGYYSRFAPWMKGRGEVSPIGSGAPLGVEEVIRLPSVVSYFGLIRPQKGLEQVVEMARIFKARGGGLRVRIVGMVMPGYEEYFARLRSDTEDLPIEWQMGLNGAALSRALAETEVAYLPFPDGASERRSSLIAMLGNKVAILTTRGEHMPSDMENAVQIAGSPAEAARLAEELFLHPEHRVSQQMCASAYAEKFSWDSIAAHHMAIYAQLITHKPQSARTP